MNAHINKHQTAVAILNWNGLKHLQAYLPSVVEHSQGAAHVVVIDNGSTDGSMALLEAQYPEVHVVRLSENQGFAGGYNEGLSQLDSTWQADWFLLLNSDVEVTTGWVDGMRLAAEENGWSGKGHKKHPEGKIEL